MTGGTSGRSFLRPPTTVSRKSQSFNAADRNKIHQVTVPPQPAQTPEQQRSRSVNAKHSFTIQPTKNGVPSKPVKKNEMKEGSKLSTPRSSVYQKSKIGNGTKIASSSKTISKSNDVSLTSSESRLSKPAKEAKIPPARPKSGLVPPRASVSRSTSNSSRTSTATTTSPERKSALTKPKSGSSVLSRFRKKTESSTTKKMGQSGPKEPAKKLSHVSSPGNTKSVTNSVGLKEKRFIPPSKLATYKSNTSSSVRSARNQQSNNLTLAQQRNLGKNEGQRPDSTKSHAIGQIVDRDVTIEGDEIVIADRDDATKARYGDDLFKRDRIDVHNLNNLLVRPYEVKLQDRSFRDDVSIRHELTSRQTPEHELLDSDEFSKSSADSALGLFQKATKFPAKLDARVSQEISGRNVQLPGASETRKPAKTATVAPFCRQLPGVLGPEEEKPIIESKDEKLKETVGSKSISMEDRMNSAKGIADLRQNLEETMVNLRNSQLKNRLSDEFERRISAQLDNDIEEITLPEVPAPLNTNYSFSDFSLKSSGLHTLSHSSSRSPKLNAGESLIQNETTRINYGSLPLSTDKSRWADAREKSNRYKEDDMSSVSSEDISELITGMSTDEISIPSIDNSPFRNASKPPPLPAKKLTLKKKISNSIESLEKSSNFAAESSRSQSSLKKSGLKHGEKERAEGSTTVGNRLARAGRSESPSYSGEAKTSFMYRNAHAYRSLPRMRKLQYNDLNEISSSSGIAQTNQQNSREGFVRSPALKILLRSKANKKSKANQYDNSATTSDPYLQKFDETKDVGIMGNGIVPNSQHVLGKTENTKNHDFGRNMTATQSLPRRFTRRAGSSTWSQARYSPNAAYSLPATPDNALYDQFGKYIGANDQVGSNSYSNLSVSEFDNQTNYSYQSRHKSFDWPGLHASPVAASSPNVNRAYQSCRTISPSDFKRRGSSLSLGAATYSTQIQKDEDSIAMTRYFLQSLSRNDAVHQREMVQEFEQSLSYLTSRLRDLATTSDEKDSELQGLRAQIENLKRKGSTGDISGIVEVSGDALKKKLSCASLSSIGSSLDDEKQKKKRGWFKSSIRSAFKSKSKTSLCESRSESPLKNGQSSPSSEELEMVQQLQEELRLKERKLTDIRLEALTSRHQLQHLQDTMNQMKCEIDSLRRENEQLHQLGLSAYTLSSTAKSNSPKSEEENFKISVQFGNRTSKLQHIEINTCPVSRSASWEQLDQKIAAIFTGYCQTIDPTDNLKLDQRSIAGYFVGERFREISAKSPELLPCGYLVGDTDSIVIRLKDECHNTCDSLAFELLIDKPILDYYVKTLLQKQKIIICSPIGSGKTLLANKLAEYTARVKQSSAILYMDAKQKALPELEDYLHSIVMAKRTPDDVTVIVLDNLQTIKQPRKLLQEFSNLIKGLFMICTTTKKIQDWWDFEWITCDNSTSPVRTYLARKLRRSYLAHQMNKPIGGDILSLVVAWLPKCWKHINDFLEAQGGDTIGPTMFSSCPMDVSSARVWFTDLWNFSVVPYVISAVKMSPLRKNGAHHFTDPTSWVLETMPWRDNPPPLHHVTIDDIEPHDNVRASHPPSTDPLYNMLMNLQEAATYDSDSNHGDHYELSIDKALTELGQL